jgi:hypothetical protein
MNFEREFQNWNNELTDFKAKYISIFASMVAKFIYRRKAEKQSFSMILSA